MNLMLLMLLDVQKILLLFLNLILLKLLTKDILKKNKVQLTQEIFPFLKIVHILNMIIFVGSENNQIYTSKIAIYDLINSQDIYSPSFQKEIANLKAIDKFLFISFQDEL